MSDITSEEYQDACREFERRQQEQKINEEALKELVRMHREVIRKYKSEALKRILEEDAA